MIYPTTIHGFYFVRGIHVPCTPRELRLPIRGAATTKRWIMNSLLRYTKYPPFPHTRMDTDPWWVGVERSVFVDQLMDDLDIALFGADATWSERAIRDMEEHFDSVIEELVAEGLIERVMDDPSMILCPTEKGILSAKPSDSTA